MTYTVHERVGLPVMEEREVYKGIVVPVATGETVIKEPGDKITKAEMAEHGQTEDDIASLIKSKAISDDSEGGE